MVKIQEVALTTDVATPSAAAGAPSAAGARARSVVMVGNVMVKPHPPTDKSDDQQPSSLEAALAQNAQLSSELSCIAVLHGSYRGFCVQDALVLGIQTAPVFVPLITPDYLGPRFANDDDWCRKECLYALQLNKHIVPVIQEGNDKNWPFKMMDDLGSHSHCICYNIDQHAPSL